jgi:catechol 2,3-dioxygenase-like lactoylglutathione lyase family enzyme
VVPSDLKESVRFYQELFGFQETWRGSRDEKTLNWIHLGIPDSKDYVELMLVPTSTPHFCLEVADLEEIKTKLDRNPYRKHYDKAIVYDVGLNRRRLTNLLDPDGIRVEIMEAETIDGVPSPSSPAAIPDHHLK